MDNYLIDQQTLGQFVDELIKKKPLSVRTTEELANFREEQIKILDDQISQAIFEQLNNEQLKEVNELLDNDETTPETFQEFFNKANVNLEKVITDTMQAFGDKFLEGGNNA